MERNRYADLLRVLAIGAVVSGHWLLTSITYRGGQLSGLDAIHYVSWAGWVTLAFQVMPVFFLVGGYVHAISWTAHHAAGRGLDRMGPGPCDAGCCGRRRCTWRSTSWPSPWPGWPGAARPSWPRPAGWSPSSCGSCRCTCC